MKIEAILLYVACFGLGWVGAFIALILMNSFPAAISISIVGLGFLILGILVSKFNLKSQWLTWLLLCIGLLVIFLPFYQIFGEQVDWSNQQTQTLLLKITGLLIIPISTSLVGIIYGKKMLVKPKKLG